MYIKVYFNEKPLYLANEMDKELTALSHHEDTVLIDEFSPPAINSLIHEMRLSKIHAGILIHNNLEALKKAFYKKFILIKAAGGLVTRLKAILSPDRKLSSLKILFQPARVACR